MLVLVLVLVQRRRGSWSSRAGASFHRCLCQCLAVAGGLNKAARRPPGAMDEAVRTVLLNAALGLEAEQVRGQTRHRGMRLGLARPAWRQVHNTAFPGHDFSGVQGWDEARAGRYCVIVYPNVRNGGRAQLLLSARSGQRWGAVESLRSRSVALTHGVELLWKL